jgi:hypothetical protein
MDAGGRHGARGGQAPPGRAEGGVGACLRSGSWRAGGGARAGGRGAAVGREGRSPCGARDDGAGGPVFPHVAEIVVPTAAHWADKYNRAVAAAAEHGYAGAKYLPAIPTERIAKVFSSAPEAEPLAEGQ